MHSCTWTQQFILLFISHENKSSDYDRRQLEIGLEFVRWSFDKRNNFSEGSSEPVKDTQVIQVWGVGNPTSFFKSNYLFNS